MYDDPIVEEIHRIREAYSASMGHDLKRMLEDFRSRQGKDGREVVSRAGNVLQSPLSELPQGAEDSKASSPLSPLAPDQSSRSWNSECDRDYHDPIVEEIHRIREVYSASMDHDMDKIIADLRSRQGKDGREVVSRAAKKPLAPLPELTPDAGVSLPITSPSVLE